MTMASISQAIARSPAYFAWRRLFAGDRHHGPVARGAKALGLREMGSYWAELYCISERPLSFMVQLTCGGTPGHIAGARLEMDGVRSTAARVVGMRLFFSLPNGPLAGDLELVVVQGDGTVVSARWAASSKAEGA